MLTNKKIEEAEGRGKDYKLSDQHSLYLLVKKNGRKTWRYKYFFNSKQKTLSIGTYPLISLDVARAKHLAARRLLMDGIDPSMYKQKLKTIKRINEDDKRQDIMSKFFNDLMLLISAYQKGIEVKIVAEKKINAN